MTTEINNTFMSDIASLMPLLAAEMSKHTEETVMASELTFLTNSAYRSDYMSDATMMDEILTETSYFPQLPLVVNGVDNRTTDPEILRKRYGLRSQRTYNLGTCYHRAKNGLVYAIVHFDANDCPYSMESGVVCLRTVDVEKFLQYSNERHIEFNAFSHAPILEDGLLDKITNYTIGFLAAVDKIKHYGAKLSRGVMLTGEPGNGKTMICKWLKRLCVESNIEYGVVTGAELKSAHSRNSLAYTLQNKPMLFIDDVDISFFSRKGNSADIACDILSAMDGLSKENAVVRVFTTNEDTSSFDKAFLRPGRIDVTFKVEKPNRRMRQALIDTWPKELREAVEAFDGFWDKTEGLSFAELEAIRTNLVSNYLFGQNGWDVKTSLDTVRENHKLVGSAGVKKTGFA